MTAEPILVRGVPGSPYTRKMIAVLRYRHIPYRWLMGGQGSFPQLPKARVELLPTLYIRDAHGELEAVVDSTPLIHRLETMFMGRSVLPTDPVLAFIDALIEDYGDEWVTKAMFHYRWHYAADIEQAGQILPRWLDTAAPEAQVQQRKTYIASRQIDRLYVVGSNPVTKAVIESSYSRLLALLNARLQQARFLLGSRPGSADFAIYGQLTQLAKFDPTPMAMALRDAPRMYAWVDVMDDLSGLDVEHAEWLARDERSAALHPLLCEIGRTYVPVLLANAAAIANGDAEVRTDVDGLPWVQQPFPYQARCLSALRQARARLDEANRGYVDTLLAGTGCMALFD